MRLLMFACLSLSISLSIAAQVPSPGGEPSRRLEIVAADADQLAASLASLGYAVNGLSQNGGAVDLDASLADQQALMAAGYLPAIVETATPLATKLLGMNDVLPGYRDLAGINAAMATAAATYPALAQVVDISMTYGVGPTHEGRSLQAIKISDNVSLDEDEPEILIVAAHHCREIVTPEIALDIMDRLLSGYASDPAIAAIIDGNEIWILPVVNPDGLDYVWTTNNLWRKNRSPQAGGEFGVDLNRNYDLGWDAACGGSTSPANITYRGPAPFSEAESATIRDLSRARRFAKVLDFHSFGREVLQTYACTPMPTLVEGFIDAEAATLSVSAGYGFRQPSADGEHQHWQTKEISSYAFLVETATEFQPAYSAAMAEAAMVWPLVLDFLQRDIPLSGHVTEAGSGLPLEVDVEVLGLSWQAGESRKSATADGRYQLFLPPGQHQLRFSKPGYYEAIHTVTLPTTAALVFDLSMSPAPPDIGQPNSSGSALRFVGAIDQAGNAAGMQNGPFFASYAAAAPVAFEFEGPPGMSFLLLGGLLHRNNAVGAGIGSLDIGLLGATGDFSDIGVLLNGVTPLSFLDLLAFLGPDGTRNFVVPAPPAPPGSSLGGFQAWVVQPVGPLILSAATEILIP